MTTYTTLARLPQIVPYDPSVRGGWGPLINSAWNAIEQLAGGNGQIDLTGLTSYTVTVANDSTDQARQAMLPFVGTPSGPCTVTIPPVSRIGWVFNGTAVPLTLTAGGTVNLVVPVGLSLLYSVTGSAVIAVPIGNFQFNGALAVPGALTVGAGATIVGALTVSGTTGLSTANISTASIQTLNITAAVSFPITPVSIESIHNDTLIGTTASINNLTVNDTFVSISSAASTFAGPVAATTFVTTSDGRAKSDIEDITTEDAYAWVRAGRARTYTIGGRRHAGFVAQEDVANGRGGAVHQVPDDRPAFALSDGYAPGGQRLTRDYNHDVAYLTRALAAALNRIDALEAAAGAV